MPAKGLVADLLEFSPGQRMQLIEQLWDSLTSSPEQLPVTEAQKLELEARLKAHETDPSAGSPWDEVKDRVRRRTRP